jgi:hypothetical protein
MIERCQVSKPILVYKNLMGIHLMEWELNNIVLLQEFKININIMIIMWQSIFQTLVNGYYSTEHNVTML